MGVTVEIVILAMVAAFLGLRLYSVLGRRAEHEEEPIQGRFDSASEGAKPSAKPAAKLPAAKAPAAQPQGAAPHSAQPHPGQRDMPEIHPSVERGLREIAAADRRFDGFAFVEGARGAYRMVLEAFWRGDKDELGQLCDRDVYESFIAAIDARTASGDVLDNRLVRIEDSAIVSAAFTAPIARIGVSFTADIATVTRDKDGTVIAGSLDDAVEARDVWTFSRNVTSSDPDWLLDETDEG